jgi:vitamin B12 transporter
MPHRAYAQENKYKTDTVKTNELPEVAVLGTRKTDFVAGSKLITIDKTILKTNPTANLAEILALYSPAHLRIYGAGILASVSLRGTSPNKTAVLWNGFNINLPTLGETDFNILPLTPNTNISLQMGASSSNYGSGAMGGAVLIQNDLDTKQTQPIVFQQDIGSFGLSKTLLQYHTQNTKKALQITLYNNSLQNDFKFVNYNRYGSPTETQQNAALHQFGFTQNFSYQLNEKNSFKINSWYADSYRQIQPAMGTRNDEAVQKDQNLRLMAAYQHQPLKNADFDTTHNAKANYFRRGTFKVRMAFLNDILNYQSNTVALSRSAVQTVQTQIEQNFNFGNHIALQTGIELQYFNATVDGYGNNKNEKRSAFFALFCYNPTTKLHLTANFRQAFVEGYLPTPTPTLGINYQLYSYQKNILLLKANLAMAYRVPTLNERFWQPGGNLNLKPERGQSAEIGLDYQWLAETLKIENSVTVYHSLIDNWVLWRQGERFWYPDNLLQVYARGVELQTKWRITLPNFSLLTGLQYQFTKSTQTKAMFAEELNKQLSYVPLHTGGLFVIAQYKKYLLQLNSNYTGRRYTTTDNINFLAPYILTNFSLGYELKMRALRTKQAYTALNIWLRCYNLTNESYQNIESRAMPMRNYAVSVQFGF